MPKHEFGIMQDTPELNKRYDDYEPCKYNCISVNDDFIEPVLVDLQAMSCFWHTLQRPEKGLAYFGITLIPPESLQSLTAVLSEKNSREYYPLLSLIREAEESGKYIIHFGI